MGFRLDPSASRIFVFEDVYPARAAEEQAEKQKLGVFGMFARYNPLNRPRPETVSLVKKERRLEPFWVVEARRSIDYTCDATYVCGVENAHARQVEFAGRQHEVTQRGSKRQIEVQVREHCHRKLDFQTHLDGLKREVKPQVLQGYVSRYKYGEVDRIDEAQAVTPLLPTASILQIGMSKLAAEAINASEILEDSLHFEKVHLFWRPVFAFEYIWTSTGRTGVLEVNGLTGEIIENGTWFKEKLDRVLTRDMLIEAGAEVAGSFFPGAGVAVRVMAQLAAPGVVSQ